MKMMPIEEFCTQGYLQEVNRQFLHTVGLALAVTVDGDGDYTLCGIQDCRDDPEGMVFDFDDPGAYSRAELVEVARKAANVKAQMYALIPGRREYLGVNRDTEEVNSVVEAWPR